MRTFRSLALALILVLSLQPHVHAAGENAERERASDQPPIGQEPPTQQLPSPTQLEGEAVRVIDGATIEINLPDGRREMVRLLQIEVPTAVPAHRKPPLWSKSWCSEKPSGWNWEIRNETGTAAFWHMSTRTGNPYSRPFSTRDWQRLPPIRATANTRNNTGFLKITPKRWKREFGHPPPAKKRTGQRTPSGRKNPRKTIPIREAPWNNPNPATAEAGCRIPERITRPMPCSAPEFS